MPELPEVETVARTLSPHVCGATFVDATLLRASSLHPLSLPLNALIGQTIDSVGRRGKLLLFHLSSQNEGLSATVPTTLVVHLRMTGRVFTPRANQAQGKHTRCIFDLACPDGSRKQLFFDDTRAFGQLLAGTPAILARWPFWKNLGPEPFDVSAADFAARLDRRIAIKSCLLDQKVIAGIGNIYADESLHKAGILPTRQADSLTRSEADRLLKALRGILRLSIRHCGSSIRDYRDADGNVGAFQNCFAVYGRGGDACKHCGQPLQKTKIGGRATVYCPNCQK